MFRLMWIVTTVIAFVVGAIGGYVAASYFSLGCGLGALMWALDLRQLHREREEWCD